MEWGIGEGTASTELVIAEIGFITDTEWQKSVKDYTARSIFT